MHFTTKTIILFTTIFNFNTTLFWSTTGSAVTTFAHNRLYSVGIRNTKTSSILQRSITALYTTTTMSSSPNNKKHNLAIHWFRNGLRFHDNRPFYDACSNSKHLLPVYIIDPSEPFSQTLGRRAGIIRANFILESMKEINTKLRALDQESRLFVFIGKPKDVLPKLIREMNVEALYYERDTAYPVKKADSIVLDEISNFSTTGDAKMMNCSIYGYDSHTLFPMEVYLAKCKDNVAPSSYGAFTKIFQKLEPVPAEIESIAHNTDIIPSLPQSWSSKLDTFVDQFASDNGMSVKLIDLESMSTTDILEIHLGYTDVKTKLSTREKGGLSFRGGEDVGLNLMDIMCNRSQWIWTFEKPMTKPNALTVDTTGLSPYIKHGCVSPRTFYHKLSKVYAECPTPTKTLSKPPVSLHGQLMWREYNNLMGYSVPNFDVMEGNPVARQIPWDDDPKLLEAWKNAQTGYPYIDAVMTQLNETGWIHHLARHSAACFLTRGGTYKQ